MIENSALDGKDEDAKSIDTDKVSIDSKEMK